MRKLSDCFLVPLLIAILWLERFAFPVTVSHSSSWIVFWLIRLQILKIFHIRIVANDLLENKLRRNCLIFAWESALLNIVIFRGNLYSLYDHSFHSAYLRQIILILGADILVWEVDLSLIEARLMVLRVFYSPFWPCIILNFLSI